MTARIKIFSFRTPKFSVNSSAQAIACAELLTENFGVLNENILVLAVIDLPDLGGSKLISDQGYSVETLVGYSDS